MADVATLRGLTILVVEDEPFIAFELERILDMADCRVQGPVATVKNALDLLADQTPGARFSTNSCSTE